jgi:hypothetical protein
MHIDGSFMDQSKICEFAAVDVLEEVQHWCMDDV